MVHQCMCRRSGLYNCVTKNDSSLPQGRALILRLKFIVQEQTQMVLILLMSLALNQIIKKAGTKIFLLFYFHQAQVHFLLR